MPISRPVLVLAACTALAAGLAAQTTVSNTQLQSDIIQKLQNDPTVNTFVVTADVNSGAVKLNGVVNNDADKAKVAAAVQTLPGVKSVDNQISVSPDELATPSATTPAPAAASTVNPALVTANDPMTRVQNALTPVPDMANVEAAVNGPDVYVFGTVPKKSDLATATHIAQKAAPGMTIHNLILVYPSN